MKPTKLTSPKAVFSMAMLLCGTAVSAQQNVSQGAESKGLGSTRLGIQNVWSPYNSPTDMHSDSTLQLGLSIARPYGIALLKSYDASLVLNNKQNAYGGYFSYVGYSVSNIISYGLSISKELHSSIILGISICGNTHSLADRIAHKQIGFSVGLKYQINTQSTLYFVAQNPTVVKEDNLLESTYSGGLTVTVNDLIKWVNEVRVSPTKNASIHTGISYDVRQQIQLFVGIRTTPNALSFGFLFRKQNFDVATSFSQHPILGFTPIISGQWSK